MAIGIGGAAAIQGGSQFLSTLADRLFRQGDRGQLERFAAFLESQRGRNIFSRGEQEREFQLQSQADRPALQRVAERINRDLGLDVGSAQTDIASRLFGQRAQRRADLSKEGRQLNVENERFFAALLARVRSQLAQD
jgi:hypothetical protein